jgi:multiple sugar transport system permease protein
MAAPVAKLSAPAAIGSYAVMTLGVLLAVGPFLYMISLSLQSDADLMSGVPVLIPPVLQFSNYVDIWQKAPFARFVLNSFIIAGGITVLHLIFDPLVGYVFAKMEFPGKRFMFGAILATLMLPFFVRMIPLYILTAKMGLLNTYPGLIMPFAMSAYGIFLMRQFIQPIPDDLISAARIDGASELGIYRRIILPQTRPAMAVLALFTFVFQWNEFLWPLVATSTPEMRTIPVGLTLFNQEYFTLWQLTAAGSVILFVPTAVLFVVTQRYFVRGIALTGLR